MNILKISRLIALSFLLLGINISSARATDISALDFNGNLLGKVIPDGAVINFNNDIIGYITADGLVFNNDKNLIGGIVPQGVAISTNSQILGKVNNDGSVTSINDSLIGKVLPNGLVVNNNYDVIGNVVPSGLVYNDSGNIVGRVSGDGKFYDLSGNNNGFVTSEGYAYTISNTDGKATLVGKLISSKIIISNQGKFLGGIAPDGKVIDLQKNFLGKIHANGFVYNDDGKSIGHIVENGYAFNLDGSYLGVVSYNGEVINQGAVVAQAVFGNRVINKNGNVIGFTISTSATFNTVKGKYLGRIIADGLVVKGRNVVGKIGASGNVINSKGEVIGLLNHTGPIFDYLGNVKANATVNGSVVSLEKMEIGYMQKASAYDQKEKEIGTTLSNKLVFDNHNNFLGMSGINSELIHDGKIYKISPYGYVFDENKNISGRNYNYSSVYAPDGSVLTDISSEALAENVKLKDKGKLVSAGYFVDKNNQILGKIISEKYATDFKGTNLGYINSTNLVANQENNLYAKILPNGEVVANDAKVSQKYGRAGNTSVSVSINGDYLGSNTDLGTVRKSDEIIGQVSSDQYVIDNQGSLYGKTISFGVAVDENCNFIGVVSENGKIRTAEGAYIGIVLANNQVMNDEQEVIGYVIEPMPVNGKNGEIIGIQSALGTVYNYQNQNLGCQDIYGKIRNPQKNLVGHILTYTSAMGFDNQILGYTNENGRIIDAMGKENGMVSEDGSVQNASGKDIGITFKYTVAFDKNNLYLGRVNSEGQVVSDEGNIIGKVNYNGLVQTSENTEGFALYDLYVYDNLGKTVGYIAKNGRVYSIMGDLIGVIHNGFVVDKKQNLIARGARDYDIRDKDKKVIGFLQLDGKVVNAKNIEIGTLADDGNILNADNQPIAVADPLQYYHREVKQTAENEDITETNKKESDKISKNLAEDEKESINKREQQSRKDAEKYKDGGKADDNEDNEKEINRQSKNKKQTNKKSSDEEDDEYMDIDDDEEETSSKVKRRKDSDDPFKVVEEDNNDAEEEDELDASVSKAPSKDETRDWWKRVTTGTTVSPYDDTNTIKNVGSSGGIGPGGRYNPRRAAILNQLYNNRRQQLSGRRIDNGNDIESYTGWQDDWGRMVKISETSSLRVNMDNMITADKAIPAIISSSVISLGKAPITAIVERNIYGMTGRNIVIPAGSRILGRLQKAEGERSDTESGGVKIEVEWSRIIRPDGILFRIDGTSGDAQGRGGGPVGYVDEQMIKKYTLPILGTMATSGVAYMMASNEDATTGTIETSKQQAANDARENFLNKMDEILDEIMKNKQKIKAVTYIPVGTRIIVYPNIDLWLRTTKAIEKGVLERKANEEVTSFVSEESAPDNPKNVQTSGGQNQNNANNNRNNPNEDFTPLIDEGPRNNNNNNNRNYGTLPPASADGSGMKMPEEEKEDDGEIDLF